MNMHHYWLWRFCSESTDLLIRCSALALWENIQQPPQSFFSYGTLIVTLWLAEVLGWLAAWNLPLRKSHIRPPAQSSMRNSGQQKDSEILWYTRLYALEQRDSFSTTQKKKGLTDHLWLTLQCFQKCKQWKNAALCNISAVSLKTNRSIVR